MNTTPRADMTTFATINGERVRVSTRPMTVGTTRYQYQKSGTLMKLDGYTWVNAGNTPEDNHARNLLSIRF